MGYAVVHMMKIGKGGVRGIQSHNQREKDSRNNPDIDKNRSNENYDIVHASRINYHKEINERIEHFATETKTVRKDAVVLCNFIITSDEKTMNAMSSEQQREFFEDSVKFFGDRYGHENIVNATVHMDETTPHMHLGLVPITDDRLSAKNLFTKYELAQLQTDYAREVGEKYGLERGTEGSERTHLSDIRYKIEMAKENEKKLKENIKSLEQNRDTLKNDCNALKNHFDSLSDVNYTLDEIKAINGEKMTLNSKQVKIDKTDLEKLKRTAEKSTYLEHKNKELSSDYERVRNFSKSLDQKFNDQYKELREVKKSLEEKTEFIQETNQLGKFNEFLRERSERRREKELKKQIEKGFERTRDR